MSAHVSDEGVARWQLRVSVAQLGLDLTPEVQNIQLRDDSETFPVESGGRGGGGRGASPDEAQRNGVILDSFGCEIPSLLPAGAGDQVDVELLELENVCI